MLKNHSYLMVGRSFANAETLAWVKRVLINGAQPPSLNTQLAIDSFFTAIKSESGLRAAIKSCVMFPPDSLVAALTPLIADEGNDPYTNVNFTSGDLSINGLQGTGGAYLNSGVVPSTDISAATSGHLACYVYNGNDNFFVDMGVSQGISTQTWELYATYGGDAYYDCYGHANGRVGPEPNNGWEGFIVGSRTSSSSNIIYRASSVTAWEILASASNAGNTRPTLASYVFAQNGNGSPAAHSDRGLSFASHGEGLSSAQGQALYNAVQACRIALGGGYR